MRHHANGRFDWLISGHQSVNPTREAISILSGKYKRFTFVHHVVDNSTNIVANRYVFYGNDTFETGGSFTQTVTKQCSNSWIYTGVFDTMSIF